MLSFESSGIVRNKPRLDKSKKLKLFSEIKDKDDGEG